MADKPMSEKMICDIIHKALEVEIVPEHIRNPDVDTVVIVLKKFMMVAMNIPESSLVQLPLEISDSDVLESMSGTARSIPLSIIYATIKIFLDDFDRDSNWVLSITDLCFPETKKIKRLFGVLACYLRFHESYTAIFDTVERQFSGQRKELQDIQKMIEIEERRKEDLRIEAESRKRKEHALLEELGQKGNKLTQIIKNCDAIEAKRDEDLKFIEKKKEERGQLLSEKETLVLQINHLSEGILKSPERIMKDLDRQRADIANVRKECKAQRHKNNEMKEGIDLGQNVVKGMLDVFQEEVQKLQISKQEVEAKRTEKHEMERILQESERRLKHLTEQMAFVESQLAEADEARVRESKLHEVRMEELHKELNELEGELISLREHNKDAMVDNRRFQKELLVIKQERSKIIQDSKNSCEGNVQLVQGFLKKYNEELQLCQDYMNKVNHQMNVLEQACQEGGGVFNPDLNMTGNTTFGASMLE